jgi:hypothetical protein
MHRHCPAETHYAGARSAIDGEAGELGQLAVAVQQGQTVWRCERREFTSTETS